MSHKNHCRLALLAVQAILSFEVSAVVLQPQDDLPQNSREDAPLLLHSTNPAKTPTKGTDGSATTDTNAEANKTGQENHVSKKGVKISHEEMVGEFALSQAIALANSRFGKDLQYTASSFLRFWDLLSKVNLHPEDAYDILRIFYNAAKRSEVISSDVVIEIAENLPTYFSRFLGKESGDDPTVERYRISLAVARTIVDHFDGLVRAPDKEVVSISKEIAEEISRQSSSSGPDLAKKLQTLLEKFLSLLAERIIWLNPTAKKMAEESDRLGRAFYNCYSLGLISDRDSLDDLWYSLTSRLEWAIDLFASDLGQSGLSELEEIIRSDQISFLRVPELDPGLLSKRERLLKQISVLRTKLSTADKKDGVETLVKFEPSKDENTARERGARRKLIAQRASDLRNSAKEVARNILSMEQPVRRVDLKRLRKNLALAEKMKREDEEPRDQEGQS